jgi:hypothetical protein
MIVRAWVPPSAAEACTAASSAEAEAAAEDRKRDGEGEGRGGGSGSGARHAALDALITARQAFAVSAVAPTSGGEYVGWFDGCAPHGRGRFRSPTCEEYVGEWRRGRMRGWGVATRPDGRRQGLTIVHCISLD